MDIKSAIEKAGPGGKGKEQKFNGNEFEVTSGGEVHFMRPPTMQEISSFYWEVIPEERIEVGDTAIGTGGGSECKVIWMLGDDCMLQKGDDKPFSFDTTKLKLIHKGPKVHTFEGVEFLKKIDEEGDVLMVPYGVNDCKVRYGKGMEDGPIMDCVGKTYRMALEEME